MKSSEQRFQEMKLDLIQFLLIEMMEIKLMKLNVKEDEVIFEIPSFPEKFQFKKPAKILVFFNFFY